MQKNNCFTLPQMSNKHWRWKNELHLNVDLNFDHQMSLSKSTMLVFKQLFTIFKECCSISCFIFKFNFEKTKIKVLDASSKFLRWTKPKLSIDEVYKIEQNWMNMFCSILFTSMLSSVWYSTRLQTLAIFFWIFVKYC